ncbi:A disintegrin and metalloproteinase with thrombospondin motifs 15 isoform X3 [Halyomorpha halys]|uniref:A disintegrin and metalloproteinase with thrombospondin motifs 15 isoform X3 n=1 Tax=Halyomorpha halys TaxID=286706 RepID=UPI0006D4E1D5|nr:A disintegrin and metalloproteinase with thrombospondin motifs 15 isoform X2 [Halyomorpha halys]
MRSGQPLARVLFAVVLCAIAVLSVLLAFRFFVAGRLHSPIKGDGKKDVPVTPAASQMSEYVRPIKVWPPLPESTQQPTDQPPPDPDEVVGYHSGHYRGKKDRIWDPHPRYKFKGFGRTFYLDLKHAPPVAVPGIKVVHVWDNMTRVEEPSVNAQGCMYTGKVVGDPDSIVSLSLCHGLTGHIWTSTGSYTIEPAEDWRGHSETLLHVLSKIPELDHSCHHDDDLHHDDFEESQRVIDEEPVMARPRRTKRSLNREYTIELMVVADAKMAEFHGNDLTLYVTNLIAAVDKIFKDPSIGNPMSVVLVKFRVLHELKWSGHSASLMLNKFCDWQKKMNNDDDSSIEHHDSALLLTREMVCTRKNCNTLGLAEVGRMCQDDSLFSCAIVRDSGLSTVFTIAHELGHVLNIPHDDSRSCDAFRSPQDKPHLMARTLDRDTRPWSWSNCSRTLLTEFLEAGHGSCLLDRPVTDLGVRKYKNKLLGENFDKDKQCELVYGKGSKICSQMATCEELWCHNGQSDSETENCSTLHMPWADGTTCGPGKWCQKRRCVSRDRKSLQPVNGGWGKWQKYGECSRTCGGGVRKSIRDCNNPTPANGGKYCLGERVRYHSCATQECPPGSTDFRELQCTAHNQADYRIGGQQKDIVWVPKYDGISLDERCKLYCRDSQNILYYNLMDKVIDGTVCGPNTFDICVNGFCQPAGCDHILNSKKQLDYCGQCGGDNSTCKLITGSFNSSQNGYTSIDTIPAGASNLDVKQRGYLNSNKDNNYLALYDNETSQYILNGHYQVKVSRKVILYGGTTLEYSGSDAIVERIRSTRPLNKDLNLQVCSVGTLYPPDITYEYTVPKSALDQYTWDLSDEWGACDKVCNGETTQIFKCVRYEGRQEFSPELCADLPKGSAPRRPCNSHCNLKWQAVSRSECSSDCGPGFRNITFECVVEQDNSFYPTQTASCMHIPKPEEMEPCHGLCVEPKWIFYEWGPCSKSCGGGIRKRETDCMDSLKHKRNDSECQISEKKVEETCNTQDCPSWQVGEWTQCSVSCGTGEEIRNVVCSVPNGCSNITKPVTSRPCFMTPCSLGHENAIPGDINGQKYSWRQISSPCSVSCGKGEMRTSAECYDNVAGKVTDIRNCAGQIVPYGKVELCYMPPCPHWEIGDWEPCSAICGSGTQSKRITCEAQNGVLLHDSACSMETKPSRIEKPCNVFCPQTWIKSAWSPCSVSCGKGIMTRNVVCYGQCSWPKPETSAPCDAGPCEDEGFWNTGPWSQCSVTCGEGTQERQVRCEGRSGEIPDSYCTEPHPTRVQKCSTSPCKPVYRWEVTRWTPCSTSCGKGTRRRQVDCKSSKGERVPDHHCSIARKRPNDLKACKKSPCPYDWEEGEWSQCTSSCGTGRQMRKVRCVKNSLNSKARKEPHEIEEWFCNPRTKPETSRTCRGYCNSVYRWEVGIWQPCSKPCSRKGKQKRNLYCYNGKKKVALKYCNKELRPERRRKCETVMCPSCQALQEGFNERRDGEYQLWIKGRNVTVFCYNMQENRPSEYLTLPPNDNFAEIFSKNLRYPTKCMNMDRRLDGCDNEWNQVAYGFTYFKKIRINITSLIVDTNDWTFATTMKGNPVSYGEAGDCQTRGLCPEGQFSINLFSTGFKVSSLTVWVGIGAHAPPKIDKQKDNQKIIGRCGGCCGFCKPKDGLRLDLLPP